MVYLNQPETEMARRKVAFVRCEDFPPIKLCCEFLSRATWPALLVNADITLDLGMMKVLEDVRTRGVLAAVSKRWTDGMVLDNGLDIVLSNPAIWGIIWKLCPAFFRMGNPRWDGWMLGALSSIAGIAFRDFTSYRCVFHPKHGERMSPFATAEEAPDNFEKTAHWPEPL